MFHRLVELFRYRDLVRNLVVRDLKVRYKNSALGFLWSLGNPLLMMLVFTFVFTVLMPSGIANFPVFVLCALLPWNWLSSSVIQSTNAIVGNAHLIKKIRFPYELLPVSTVMSNGVNFLLALVVLFAVVLVFGVPLSWTLVLLPVVIALQAVLLIGIAFLLSAINVYFRDTEVIMDVLVLAWFFMTPVFYDIKQMAPQYERLMYWLNPMASMISTYRVILLGGGALPDAYFLTRTTLTAFGILLVGYLFFLRCARSFGEEL